MSTVLSDTAGQWNSDGMSTEIKQADARLAREPEKCPNLADLKRAIPAHCFQSSATRSVAYLVRDVCMALVLAYGALHIRVESTMASAILWNLYGFTQGLVFTGIWILAHECGHGAFSAYRHLNDTVGWLCHSFLGVPYFSWKITHARHHRFTGHLNKDVAFVPHTAEEVASETGLSLAALEELCEDTPLVTTAKLIAHQLLGWQAHLIFNISAGHESHVRGDGIGGKGWFSARASHFDPWSDLFLPQQARLVILSDIGLALTAYALYTVAQATTWQTAALLWAVPYMWVHHWLVAITFLQHTHADVPRYGDGTWTFTLGNLCTIDRDFGFIGDFFFHRAINDHVVHHLFPKIPHYHASEATAGIRPLLGEFYNSSRESFLISLWKTFRACRWVKEEMGAPAPQTYHWVRPSTERPVRSRSVNALYWITKMFNSSAAIPVRTKMEEL
ncbi:Fatty acid desaturase type 1 [Neofusicoccum parvum]|uniref:Fatty acid desaturase type 1 n=1 Tax=Neofusicoccum parvum TaxID=310453 RepID=A0ACB5SAT3_9PEZI|nr:Fatty acid desaturase type 1 [Neofusicoccum parvum]